MKKGKFISFEGPEGSGKSTHIRLLASFLESQKIPVLLTREPGGTLMGDSIRSLLQHDGAKEPPVPRAEVLLFLASRAQHVEKIIVPAVENGVWVLCDRFEDSTFAYQGYGRGFCLSALRAANRFATDGVKPDLTLLLDVSPRVSRERLSARQARLSTAPDRIEQESDDFHIRVRDGFLALAHDDPGRFAVFDTARGQDEVAAHILRIVRERLLV